MQDRPPESFPRFLLETDDVILPPCIYSDVGEIPNPQNDEHFAILLFNIRSVRKNFLNFLCHFEDYICNYSCVVLTETWLTNDYCNLFKINGFKHYDLCRSQFGGGIRIYIKDDMNLEILSDFTTVHDLFEIFSVEVSSVKFKFILSVFYHRPTADHALNNVFIEECCIRLNQMLSTGLPLVTCGDFNLNLLNPLRLNYIDTFIGNMLELGLYPGVTIPTKYNEGNPITQFAILDLAWTSTVGIMDGIYVIPTEITDHYPVLLRLNFEVMRRENKVFSRRISSNHNKF